jgi:hypothetical protein
MTLLTAEQCRDTAFRKMMEAKSLELVKTAQAWLTLAEQIERAEALGRFARRDRLAAQRNPK